MLPRTASQADNFADRYRLRQEAQRIEPAFDGVTTMIAQAKARLWLDTLVKLHEAGLEEAINANDPKQASAFY